MATTWKRLVAGESGIGPITLFDVTEYKCKIAGEVKDFDGSKYLSKKEIRHNTGISLLLFFSTGQVPYGCTYPSVQKRQWHSHWRIEKCCSSSSNEWKAFEVCYAKMIRTGWGWGYNSAMFSIL